MIQRADTRIDVVQEVVARITGALRPWRIVLFGSRARGSAKEHSDYDIFVEFDADRGALKAIHAQIRALFLSSGWTLDFKLARRGDLERRRDDPGTIEWDVAREGKLLYADPAAPKTLALPDRVREPSPEPPESVGEWLEAAERDLRHCRKHQEDAEGPDTYYPEICWLSHQAAEKYLKALLVSRRVHPERTHDLKELLAALRAAGCALGGLEADCALLTEHAITPRYPAGLDLGEEDARAAFAALEHVVAAVRADLPRRLH
ncbi:MAG: HEPN domain-containing protein [Gemmatimonadaceae bacterium]